MKHGKNQQFVADVLSTKTSKIRKSSRTEPIFQISEFNLSKSKTSQSNVHLGDLSKGLKKRSTHVKISNNFENTTKKSKILSKPLENVKKDRIKRIIAFGNVKNKLNKWESLVSSNRSANYLKFPLTYSNSDSFKIFDYNVKSDLQKNLEDLMQPAAESDVISLVETHYPLTMEEMLKHRKEMSKLRALQRNREVKMHRQSKIKSKRYHRIQKREKLKQQVKAFEELQKTNPSAAMQKLDEIEKTRAKERASLRHRSGGKWAKNKQIQAKYDKESRQALAQQLNLSRQLTQKLKTDNSDDESTKIMESKNTIGNPWIKSNVEENEVEKFLSSYRKFWDKQNVTEVDKNVKVDVVTEPVSETNESNSTIGDNSNLQKINLKNDPQLLSKRNLNKKNSKETKHIKRLQRSKLVHRKNVGTSDWIIDTVTDDSLENYENGNSSKSNKQLQNTLNSGLKSNTHDNQLVQDNANKRLTEICINNKVDLTDTTPPSISLDTHLPDLLVFEDNEATVHRKDTISEAFEDDDVLDEFAKVKRAEIESTASSDINLNLPGWGSWGGTGIKLSKRKEKRFIFKMPKIDRKDNSKQNLIINENASKNIKEHLVSEVPFPFKKVKDFEAAIRSPIGNTFVPETAYRRNIKPAIRTKMGTVIEPMTDDMLLKKK